MKRWGLAVGMLLGAAAGLFLAPGRGAERRRRLGEVGREMVELAAGPFHTAAQELSAALRQRRRRADLPDVCAPTL